MKKLNLECLVVVVAGLAVGCGPTGNDGSSTSSSSSSSGSHGNMQNQQCPAVMCAVYCENGYEPGPGGCPTCECQGTGSSSGGSTSSSGGQVCPAIACNTFCPFGFAADRGGCPTCECLPGSCGSIDDQQLCHNTATCVPVFLGYSRNDPSSGGGASTPTGTAFQCCTQTSDGVFCDGAPPPPAECMSDADCGRGDRCDTANFCDSPCEPGSGQTCVDVCVGRCVPGGETNDCRTQGCGPGYACEGMGACPPVACACRSDMPDCSCPPPPPCDTTFQCVPVQQDCREYGCRPGYTCQGFDVCATTTCGCPAGDATCDCPPPPPCDAAFQCVPDSPPAECATVRCEANTTCVACEPNMDCIVHCVPVDQDCRTLGCGPGFACEGTGLCPDVACACPGGTACECPMPPPCETAYVCVAVNNGDCRTNGCAPGQACQEMQACSGGSACTCSPGDAGCDCPPNVDPVCTSSWACMATEDPCNAFTQDQCGLHYNQCTPMWATACPACTVNGCDQACTTTYVGCVSIMASTDGGTRPPPQP